jgi:hypothetical protein
MRNPPERITLRPVHSFSTLAVAALLSTFATSAHAQLDLSASGSASADSDTGASASAEGASSDANTDSSAAEVADPAAGGETKESEAQAGTQSDAQSEQGATIEGPGFGDAYTFAGPGRLIGIPGGSLSGTNQGYQMSWHKTGLLFSGNTWIDTGYRKRDNDVANDEEKFIQQGRVLLRLTPTYTYGDWFVRAQGELLAHAEEYGGANASIDTDDAWVMFGRWDTFDIQLGRFEAWEVYHKGMGLERDTLEDEGATEGSDIYEVNHAFYRQAGVGQAALHVYPLEWLRFELGSVLGNQFGRNSMGVRPVVIADFDMLKVKFGAERRVETNEQINEMLRDKRELYGFGGSVQLILDPHVELGGNLGLGYTDVYDQVGTLNRVATTDTTSFGGFVNARMGFLTPALKGLMLGAGANFTVRNNESCAGTPVLDAAGNPVLDAAGNPVAGAVVCGKNEHNQMFAAIQHDVFDHATIKLVAGVADANHVPGADEPVVAQKNSMYNVRLRFLVWY